MVGDATSSNVRSAVPVVRCIVGNVFKAEKLQKTHPENPAPGVIIGTCDGVQKEERGLQHVVRCVRFHIQAAQDRLLQTFTISRHFSVEMLLGISLHMDQLSEPGWGWCATTLVISEVSVRERVRRRIGAGNVFFCLCK